MAWRSFAFSAFVAAFAAILLTTLPGAASAAEAEDILNARCGACHADEEGGLSRLTGQRKTPEGWLMTIVRMGIMHGVEVPPDEKRALVKYLADTQGLAPSEAAPYRYILERQPAHIEDFAPEYFFMCARCHSGARGALQRRTKAEWRMHMDFHLGQFPTTEYQFYGRDRAWWHIAATETTDWLAENFPYESAAWDAWKGHQSDISGDWRWIARGPGIGFAHGTFNASGGENDQYTATGTLNNAMEQGTALSGTAIVYTGYEFRARLTDGTNTFLSIAALSEDGSRSTGRYMNADQDEIGLDFLAVKVQAGHSEIMAIEPSHIRAGSTAEIAIHGTGLSGDVDLGSGVTVTGVVSADANTVVVTASADAGAGLGARSISVGGTAAAGDALVVYDAVASVQVEPAFGLARVGGAGGTRLDQLALFDAVGYTADGARIGVMQAAWTTEPFDEVADQLDDVHFAGVMAPSMGIYDPADAGLNPARPFSTNNAGNLKVVAVVDDAGNAVRGEGQLIVTVQRWNDPPIR
jgi:quinohemoprotein amine dehydrogenase